MKPSPEEDLAAKKVLKAMTKVSTLEAGGNLLITISTAAAVITPVVLSLVTGDWSKIFLLLLYPLALFPMSLLKHSSSSFSLLKILLPAIALILCFTITNAPGWYWFIALGLTGSYHLLFNSLPLARMKADRACEDTVWKRLQLIMEANSKVFLTTIPVR